MIDTSVPSIVALSALGGFCCYAIVQCIGRWVMERKYGTVRVPADIIDLQANLGAMDFDLVRCDFQVIAQGKGREHLRREMRRDGGAWTLDIELKDGRIIAFDARFRSDHSWFLNRRIAKAVMITRFVADAS